MRVCIMTETRFLITTRAIYYLKKFIGDAKYIRISKSAPEPIHVGHWEMDAKRRL